MPLPLSRALPALGLFCALAAPATAQTPTELPLDTWVTGVLEAMDSRPYRLPADFTGWVEIVLESGAFDTYAVWSPGGDQFDIENDHAAGLTHETDSRIVVQVKTPGEGIFRATGFSPGGEYRVRATVIDDPQRPTPIAYGDEVEDAIDPTLHFLPIPTGEREPARLYEFAASAGDQVWITLESRDFDAVLRVLANGETLEYDDDGLQGTDALVWIEIPKDGAYTVVAGPRVGDFGGTYRLRIGEGAATAPGSPPGGRPSTPALDASSPLSYVVSRDELVPAVEMPRELVMIPHELDWLVDDGSRLVNEDLGFDLPSPDRGVARMDEDDLLELRSDVAKGLFGVEAPPTNLGVWGYGSFQQGWVLIIMAIKSGTPPDVEALTTFGGRFARIVDGPAASTDIQWEESRSADFRFTLQGEIWVPMRCTAGQEREPGGLIVCAAAFVSNGLPDRIGASEELLAGLRVR